MGECSLDEGDSRVFGMVWFVSKKVPSVEIQLPPRNSALDERLVD